MRGLLYMIFNYFEGFYSQELVNISKKGLNIDN